MPIAVRPHFFTGAGLLAAAALLGVVGAFRPQLVSADATTIAYLGGTSLLAQGIAYWYLPSFAKREVVLDGMASYSGPVLFPLALVATLFGLDALRTPAIVLGVAIFPVVLAASVVAGPRWRSGIPFWRTEGTHQRGDLAAAIVLASALAWLAWAGVSTLVAPPALVIAWPAGLGLFALGALAHLVPRSRARPMLAPAFLVATLLGEAGLVLASLARVGIVGPWTRVGYALLAAFALAALAIAPPGRGKPAGPRGREASPFLWAAVAALLLGVVAAAAWPSMTLARATVAYRSALATVGLALAGLALLTAPVLFNQRPATGFLLPSLLAFLGAGTLLAARLVTPIPGWPVAAALGAGILLWLAAMAPLRTPRRECP